jgi:hypothetical protein
MTLADTDLAELERVVALLKTQDNAITADPIFMVQQRHRQYGMDEELCEHYCFVHADDSDHEVNEESDPTRFERFSDDDFGEDDPEFWTRTGYVDTWQNIQPFLTREAAEEFRKREAHNLGETRVYVESAYRNQEWRWLRALLPAVATELSQYRSRIASLRERLSHYECPDCGEERDPNAGYECCYSMQHGGAGG